MQDVFDVNVDKLSAVVAIEYFAVRAYAGWEGVVDYSCRAEHVIDAFVA